MSLSFKQFQDLLCKNGCGFMARPTLQGYCPKCWSDKCLPSSSSDSDESSNQQPNLSSITPVTSSSAKTDAKTNKDGKTKQQSDRTKKKVVTPSVSSNSIGNLPTGTRVASSHKKVANPANDSIESILSLTGVSEAPTGRPLTFWDVDGGDEAGTSKTNSNAEFPNSIDQEPGELQIFETENTSSMDLPSAKSNARERSPSPDLEVLEDVKKPEPEVITIDDTDDTPVVPEPVVKQIVNTRPQVTPTRTIAPRFATSSNQIRFVSPPRQGSVAYVPIGQVPFISNSQIRPVSGNSIINPIRMPVRNSAPVGIPVVPSPARGSKQTTTRFYLISSQPVLGSPAPQNQTSQQPCHVYQLNTPQIPAVRAPSSTLVANAVAGNTVLTSQASGSIQRPASISGSGSVLQQAATISGVPGSVQPPTTRYGASGIAQQLATISGANIAMQQMISGASGVVQRPATMSGTSRTVQQPSTISGTSRAVQQPATISGASRAVQQPATISGASRTVQQPATMSGASRTVQQPVTMSGAIQAVHLLATSGAGENEVAKGPFSLSGANEAVQQPASKSGTSKPAQKSSNRPIILSKSPVQVTAKAAQGTHVMLETHPVSKGTASNANRSQINTVYISPPQVSTGTRVPAATVTNSRSTITKDSNLWSDWRKRITGNKSPTVTAPAPAPTLVPKPPQPTRLMQIMTGQPTLKTTRSQTIMLDTRTTAKTNTTFSSLLQHFHGQIGAANTQRGIGLTSSKPRQPTHQPGTQSIATGGCQEQTTTKTTNRTQFKQPVRKLNKRPTHKCRYCQKHFKGDVRYFRNHVWMHKQRYRPYWYVKDDDDDTSEKDRPQIGRRPFMLLYTPGARTKRKRKTNLKKVLKRSLSCRFCAETYDSVEEFMFHEQDHMKTQRRPLSHCGICCIDLSWKTSLRKHIPTSRHQENVKTFHRYMRSFKREPSSFWPSWNKSLGNPKHLLISTEQIGKSAERRKSAPSATPVNTSSMLSATLVPIAPPPIPNARQVYNHPPSLVGQRPTTTETIPILHKPRTNPERPSSTMMASNPDHSYNIKSIRYSGKDWVNCSRCGVRMMRKSLSKHDRSSICGKTYQESLAKLKEQEQNVAPQQPDLPRPIFYHCNTCGAKFDEENHLTLHQLAHTRDKLYSFSCKICGANFARRELLATHKRVHDIDTPFPCKHCNQRFRKEEELTYHVRGHHSDIKPCICMECSACFSDQAKLDRHMAHVHKLTQQPSSAEDDTVGSFACGYCTETFKDQDLLSAHQKIHDPNTKGEEPVVVNKVLAAAKPCFICLKCGKEFRNNASLQGHYKSVHFSGYKCKECNKTFSKSQSYANHMRSHTRKLPRLNESNKKTVVAGEANAQKSRVIVGGNELFSRSGILKRILGGDGISTISGDGQSEGLSVKVSASKGNNVFDPNKNVIINNELEQKSNNNKENLTSKDTVASSSNQKDTVMSSSNQKDAVASSFIQDTAAPVTQRVRKLSKCKYCVKMFLKKSKLMAHQKMHSIYRPYQCQHCFSRFKDRSLLVKHTKTHLPYPCGACDKTWVTYNGFVNHAVEVHGELKEALLAAGSPPIPGSIDSISLRGHRCIFCSRRFCREGMRLKTHRRNHLLYYKKFRVNKPACSTSNKGAIGDILRKALESNDAKEVPATSEYCCGFCGEAFFSRSEVTEHMSGKCPKRRKLQEGKTKDKGADIRKSSHKQGETEKCSHKHGESVKPSHKQGESVKPSHKQGESENSSHKHGESEKSSHKHGESETSSHKQGESKKDSHKQGESETSSQQNRNIKDQSQEWFACYCGAKYSWAKSLERHRRKMGHFDKSDNVVTQENNLKSSEEVTAPPIPQGKTNETKDDTRPGAPYTCPDCKQTFSLWRLREEHIRRVHKNFTCGYCQKTFLVYQILMKHEKKHKARGDVMKKETATETGKSNDEVQEEKKKGQGLEEKNQKLNKIPSKTSSSTSGDLPTPDTVESKEEPEEKSPAVYNASPDSDWDAGSGGQSESSESDDQDDGKQEIMSKIKAEKTSEDESDLENKDQFKCEKCDRTFRRRLNLIQHSRIHKEESVEKDKAEEEVERNIKCDECDRTFARYCDLKQHMKAHTLKKYPCDLCSKSFDKYLLLLRHNKYRHPGHKVVAPGSKVNKDGHGKNKKLTCKVCFEEFTDADKMAEHEKIHSSEKNFVCHVCNMKFIQSWDLIVHKRTHSRDELRRSSVSNPADAETSNSDSESSPSKPIHVCKFCGYVCKDSSHLEDHERTHSSKLTCNFCGKTFQGNDALLFHYNKVHYAQRSEEEESPEKMKKKHDQENDEQSDWDDIGDDGLEQDSDSESDSEVLPEGGRYPRRGVSRRKRYISSDEEDVRYPKRQRNKTSYKEPTEQDLDLSASDKEENQVEVKKVVSNNTDEPYRCSYCGIGFSLEEDWSFHEYQHLQLEPFRCQFCFKLFSRRSNLIVHEKSHQGLRPYSCLECGATFAEVTGLRLHKEQQHSKPQTQRQVQKTNPKTLLNEPYPYNCDLCDKGFYARSKLLKHQEKCKESEDTPSTSNIESVSFVKERNAAKLARLQISVNQTSSDDGSDGNEPIEESEEENNDEEDETFEPHGDKEEDVTFQCRFCHKNFPLKKQMVKHEIGVHKAKGPLECAYCDKAFWDANRRDVHQNCHKRNGDPLRTGKESSSESEEEQEDAISIKEEEKDIVYKCRFCKKKRFAFKKMLIKHEIKVHNAKGRLKCGYCDKLFWFPYEKKRHEEMKHKYDRDEKGKAIIVKCKVCSKTFPNKEQLKNHEKTHELQQTFKCRFCLKSFQSQSDLAKHEEMHNVPKEAPSTGSFGCLFCHEMFTLKSALIDHIQTHSGRESYMCPHCDLTFPTSATLQAHEREHLQPTIYQCSHCHALFRDKEKLIKHEASHEDTGYRCSQCNVTFISSQGLSKHLLTQHGEIERDRTPSPCVLKEATKKKILQPVIKLHSISPKSKSSPKTKPVDSDSEEEMNEEVKEIDKDIEVVDAIVNPYSCNVCKKSFPTSDDLKSHVRSHSKDQGKKCTYCGKTFNKMSTLRLHLRLHLRSMQNSDGSNSGFKCQICSVSVFTKAGLISHLKSHAKTKAKPFSFHKRNTGFGLNSKFKQVVKSDRMQDNLSQKSQKTSGTKKKTKVASPGRSQASPRKSNASSPEKSSNSPSKVVTCKYCNKTLSGRLARHIESVHSKDRPHKCEVCDDRFKTEADLKTHSKCHGRGGDKKAFHCENCDESFISYANLTNHMDIKHPTVKFNEDLHEVFRCKVCNKAFAMKRYLRRHELVHMKKGEVPPVKDTIAQKSETPPKKSIKKDNKSPVSELPTSSSTDSVTKSTNVATGTLFDCKYCSFQFITLEDMKRHERTHPGEKPYSCEDCHKSYYKRSHLTVHRAKAHGPKSPTTSMPEKSQTTETVKIKTEPGVSDEEVHRCKKCNKGFTMVASLKKHYFSKHGMKLTLDPPKKQHPCYKCDKIYKNNGVLKDHFVRVHKKKFEPERVNIIIETGNKSVKVKTEKQLKYHSAQNSDAEQETKEQSDTGPVFKCSECDKCYNHKPSLKRHYNNVHVLKEDTVPSDGQQEPSSEEEDDTGDEENPGETEQDDEENPGETEQDEEENFSETQSDDEENFSETQQGDEENPKERPEETQRNDRVSPCPVCGKLYSNKGNVKRHFFQVHSTIKEEDEGLGQDLYSCFACGKSYLTYAHLQDHYSKVHEDKEPKVKAIETRKPKAIETPKPKVEQSDRERNHHCDMCEKSYMRKSHLTEHINRVHSGVKNISDRSGTPDMQTPEVAHPSGSGSSNGGAERTKLVIKKKKLIVSEQRSMDGSDSDTSSVSSKAKSVSSLETSNRVQSGKREREGSTERNIYKKMKVVPEGDSKPTPSKEIKLSSASHSMTQSDSQQRSHSPAIKITSKEHAHTPGDKLKVKSGHHSSAVSSVQKHKRSNSPANNISAKHSSHSTKQIHVKKHSSTETTRASAKQSSSSSNKNLQGTDSQSSSKSWGQPKSSPVNKVTGVKSQFSSFTKLSSAHSKSSTMGSVKIPKPASLSSGEKLSSSHSKETPHKLKKVSSSSTHSSKEKSINRTHHIEKSSNQTHHKVKHSSQSSGLNVSSSHSSKETHKVKKVSSSGAKVSSQQQHGTSSSFSTTETHKVKVSSSGSKVSSQQQHGASSSFSTTETHKVKKVSSSGSKVSSQQQHGASSSHSSKETQKVKKTSSSGGKVSSQQQHGVSLFHSSKETIKVKKVSSSGSKVSSQQHRGASSSHSSKETQKVKKVSSSGGKVSSQQQREVPPQQKPLYACHVCERTFTERSNLAEHFQRYHS